MKYDPMSPIWLQVMKAIETEIVAGRLAPGAKLPGGRDLALQYTINPNTAARVYQELEKEGLCETKRGLGTFVTENQEKIAAARAAMAKSAMDQCLQTLKNLGISRAQAAEMIMKEDG